MRKVRGGRRVPRLIATIATLLLSALTALNLADQGGARSAELVKCSSTTPVLDSLGRSIDLTGTWTASDRQPYYLRQVGSCLWWSGSKAGSNVFFGTVSTSRVVGQWADVRNRTRGTSGTLTLLMTSGNTVLLRRGPTGPVKYLRKSQ
jgi:hypothetical protein